VFATSAVIGLAKIPLIYFWKRRNGSDSGRTAQEFNINTPQRGASLRLASKTVKADAHAWAQWQAEETADKMCATKPARKRKNLDNVHEQEKLNSNSISLPARSV